MSQFKIIGGKKLQGEIEISGNKNSVLPLLAATLLSDQEVEITNVPKISDVEVFLEILKSLGAETEYSGHRIKVRAKNIKHQKIDRDLARKLRASILFIGPLLSRFGKAEFYHPGGDLIGIRTIEPHIEGFKKIGYSFKRSDRNYSGARKKSSNKKIEVFLEEASVTGTENLIMASVLGERTIILRNCAQEPHIVDLCNLLLGMGASISGVGTSTLTIKGVKKLSGTKMSVGFDFVEMGTYAVAAAVTSGEILLKNCSLKNMEPVTLPLQKMGVKFEETPGGVKVSGKDLKAISKLHTNIWPGFPTDLMSAAIVLATQAKGESLLHDWMYESRMFFVDKLISMGARITIADPHRVLVYGSTSLMGRYLETPDIRAGMALVLAALAAEGESVIHSIELIERGYQNVVLNIQNLGGSIERID